MSMWNTELILLLLCINFTYLLLLLFIIIIEKGREKEERNINVWLPLGWPLLGTWHTIQACGPTGNPTGDPLVHRLVLNPLSHTSQGKFLKLYLIDYATTVVLISLLCPHPFSTLYSLRQPPHHCSCPWVMCINSMATPIPVL